MSEYTWIAPYIIRHRLSDQPDQIFSVDPTDTKYLAFQTWMAAGNTPDPMPPQRYVTSGSFLDRFTLAEQVAIQTFASTNQGIALGLTMEIARGTIDLESPILANWMAGLVASGVLTPARATTVLTQ